MQLVFRIWLLLCLVLSGIPVTHAAGTIQRGQACVPPGGDPGPPANWPNLDATCAGGPSNSKCRPGPAGLGAPQAWYCMREDYQCSYPGNTTGDPEYTQRGALTCQCPPSVAGPFCRFAPWSAWCVLIERSNGSIVNKKQFGSQSEASQAEAPMKSDSQNTTGESLTSKVVSGACP